MSLKKYIPNTITCLNLVCGCLATYMAFHQGDTYCWGLNGLEMSYVLIGMAAVFDFCDGLMARLLHQYSDIGKELDSLSDLVSFGVAPGMMMLNIMEQQGAGWISFAALMIPVCGALRLAKFNTDDTQTTSFAGLPIPANAIFWIGLSGWIASYHYPGTPLIVVAIVLISLAMVSRFRMFSLKFKNFDMAENFRRYIIILAAVLFVICYGVSGLMWTIILYLFISILTRNRG